MDECPCCSGKDYSECCGALILGKRSAETAEQLMRSRYTAYAKVKTDYLLKSTHPDQRADFNEKEISNWARNSEWHGLEIINIKNGGHDDTEGTVEFIATYSQNGVKRNHHELALFKKLNDDWFFEDGGMVSQKPVVRSSPRTGRNNPCPCGSGKKYKKCCLNI